MRLKQNKNLILRNTSRYPTEEAWVLLVHCYAVACSGRKAGFIPPKVVCDLQNASWSRSGRYTGREDIVIDPELYKQRRWNSFTGGYEGKASFKRILCRIGRPHHWPRKERYAKFKDMPEYEIKDYREGLIHIIAHEMEHTFGSRGGKEGEIKCEDAAHDAVVEYRRNKEQIDLEIETRLKTAREKQDRKKAKVLKKKAPESKLMKAQARLAIWERKAKIAQNKVKKYTRLVKRIERKLLKEQVTFMDASSEMAAGLQKLAEAANGPKV